MGAGSLGSWVGGVVTVSVGTVVGAGVPVAPGVDVAVGVEDANGRGEVVTGGESVTWTFDEHAASAATRSTAATLGLRFISLTPSEGAGLPIM